MIAATRRLNRFCTALRSVLALVSLLGLPACRSAISLSEPGARAYEADAVALDGDVVIGWSARDDEEGYGSLEAAPTL